MSEKVAVIGDGAWGTALGLVALGAGHRVTIWSPFPEHVAETRAAGENARFLPGVRLPPDLEWTTDRAAAVRDARLVVLAVPTRYYRSVLEGFAGLLPQGSLAVSVAKGLDPQTFQRMSCVAESVLKIGPVAALSGPSHAEEVARHIPTAVVVAAAEAGQALAIQGLLATPRFRIYTSTDIAGVELGGALKNVVALAVGVSDGLGFGDNTRAALITRGLAEITRLGCALGARAATFAGLSGMGDLIVTCTSRLSRNHNAGERIGRGEHIADILGTTQQAIEGVWTSGTARDLAHKLGVAMPVTEEVAAIINDGKNALEAVNSLLARDVKPE